jgi:hypothetical protein
MSSTTALPTDLPIAPLSSDARHALRSLELRLTAGPGVVEAITRYEVASARTAELSAMDARTMSGAEFDSLVLAQDMMAAARATLADAGQLHLIESVKAVA